MESLDLLNRKLSKAGRWSLILAAALLPFELERPLLVIGPFKITSVEAALYLVIGMWAANRLKEILSPSENTRTWRLSAVHAAVILWAAAVIVSALCASVEKTAALKFALRSLVGCALFFAASRFAADARTAARVCIALLAGSCISAAAGMAEVRWPGASAFLMNFKTQSSLTGGYLRASGTFQYVNIASMYWEACLPLALTVPFFWSRRRPDRSRSCLAAGASILLSASILAGASRAGIVIAILMPIALILVSIHSAPNVRAPAGITLSFLAAMILLESATGGLPALRLTRDVSGWYRVEYSDYPSELKLQAGRLARVPVTIRNDGTIAWRVRGPQAVTVTYHWLDASGKTILVWQGARSEMPSDVEPGGTTNLQAWVVPPSSPGSYALQWDLVQKDVTWFSVSAPNAAQIKVEVLPSGSAPASADYRIPVGYPLPRQPGRVELWGAALRLWMRNPWFGSGPDNFRHLYGPVLGLKDFDPRIHANNLYLETLADLGLFGMLGLIAVLAAVSAALLRAWRAAKEAPEKLLVAGIAGGLAAFCVHGLVDYFLPFTPTYGLFWVLAGMKIWREPK